MLTRIMVIMKTISSSRAKARRLVFGIPQFFSQSALERRVDGQEESTETADLAARVPRAHGRIQKATRRP